MRDHKLLLKTLADLGWQITLNKSRHYKLLPPHDNMTIVVTSLSPSDHRAIANIRADIRRSYKQAGRNPPL
jgi:hypothetical protein